MKEMQRSKCLMSNCVPYTSTLDRIELPILLNKKSRQSMNFPKKEVFLMFKSDNITNSAIEMNWIGRNKLLYTVGDLAITFFIDADNTNRDVYIDPTNIIANNKKAKIYFRQNQSIIKQDVLNWITQQGCKPMIVDVPDSVCRGKIITGNSIFVGDKQFWINKFKRIWRLLMQKK